MTGETLRNGGAVLKASDDVEESFLLKELEGLEIAKREIVVKEDGVVDEVDGVEDAKGGGGKEEEEEDATTDESKNNHEGDAGAGESENDDLIVNNERIEQKQVGEEYESGLDAKASVTKKYSDANKSTLYLGNLHPFVTDLVLQGVFAGLQGITELKVIKDRATGVSAGYGFARFSGREYAEIALRKVTGCAMFGQPMKVNWALQKEKEDELGLHHHIFVGDLSPEITDGTLLQAFSNCQGCSDARVMWDHATGRSRGYGFVSFKSKTEAQHAIEAMDGAHIGSRCIRCGWAQHKTEAALPSDPTILDRSDPTNTNVYVGNLPAAVSDGDVREYFGKFGAVVEMKLHRKGNFGFVRYRSHLEAVQAIVEMNSKPFQGRKLKCSWGRHPKVPPSGVKANLVMAAVAAGVPQQAAAGLGVMPQPQALNPHQRPHSTMLSQMSPSHLMGQMTGDPDQAMMQGMTGMNLYGGGQIPPMGMPQDISGPHRLQPHQLDPSLYAMGTSSRFPEYTNMPPHQGQYGHLGNQSFQK